MASTANPFAISLSSKPTSLRKTNNSSDSSLRVQSPNSVSLRSSFVSPSSIELSLNRGMSSVSSASRVRSRICASSAQVMESAAKTDFNAPTIVDVDLGNRSYPIYIGSGLLDQPHLLQK